MVSRITKMSIFQHINTIYIYIYISFLPKYCSCYYRTLWICVTTANYPDVMMPSYNENRLMALYFISFMVISFFYLINLVLAVTVNS